MIDTTKIRRAMRAIAARKGDFTLFALLRRPDALGDWDVVVSAPWLEQASPKTRREFAGLLATSVGGRAMVDFARIQPVNQDHPTVKSILSDFPVEDGELRVPSTTLFGLLFDEGIIFRAKKPSPARTESGAKGLRPVAAADRRGRGSARRAAAPKQARRRRVAAGR